MLWYIELKFCIWLCFSVLQIKFECRQFASIFVGVMPLLELRIMEIHSFPHFFLTCFDILSWNFAYDFFNCTTDQVRVSSICVDFCRSYAPFRTSNTENTQFSALFSYMLWHTMYWAEILHISLFHRTTDQVRMLSICINSCGSYAPFGTSNTENSQFSALFSYMLWHIELKCCIWLCFTILHIEFECRQFASIFVGVMPLLELKMMKYTVFRTFLLHAMTYWAEILHMTLFYCTSNQVQVSSISVTFCRSCAPCIT